MKSSEFKIWKTIILGNGIKCAKDFSSLFKDSNIGISYFAKEIIENSTFTVATQEVEVDLVVRTVERSRFDKDLIDLGDIYNTAIKCGLEICPVEVGPQLRLRYKDQPPGEQLLIGHKPIFGSGYCKNLFCVGRNEDHLWLGADYVYCGHMQNRHCRFVFVLPRK